VLIALGAATTAYGLALLLGLGADQVVGIAVWLAGGLVVHDAIIAPAVVLLGVVAATRAPGWLRTPLLWVLVVLGPLTLVAVPVLGRFGAKADNPTLLDRNYLLGYALVVVLVVGAAGVMAVRRRRGGPPG
jgi:hypothetical protein